MQERLSVVVAIVLASVTCSIAYNAGAQDDEGLGLYAVGGGLNYVKPSGMDGALGFGVHADIGDIGKGFELFPGIGYWANTADNEEYSGYAVKTRELTIEINVHYYLNPEATTNWYVGGGVGLFNSKLSYDMESAPSESDISTKSAIGMTVLGGLEHPVGSRTRIIGEARYKIDGTIDAFKLVVGLSLEM